MVILGNTNISDNNNNIDNQFIKINQSINLKIINAVILLKY